MNRILIVVLLSLIASSGVFAQPFDPPWLITYQGRFENNQGAPMPAGQYDVIFGLWDSEFGGGPPFWSEAQTINVDADGLFDVRLGRWVALDPANWPADNQLWLALGYNEEFLAPRVPLCAVPFAFHADNVLKFDSMEPDEFRQSVVDYAVPRFMVDGHYTRSTEGFSVPANGAQQYVSDPYVLPYESYVQYYAYAGYQYTEGDDPEVEVGAGTIQIELLNSINTIVAQSLILSAANPGSPILHAVTQGEIPAGTYRTRVTFHNNQSVHYMGWEAGAVWQGE